jgi:tetratricopeptide (TPR) repeat protein
LGNVDEAIEVSEQSLVIARVLTDHSLECHALLALSCAYNSLGYTYRAVGYAEQALVLAHSLENRQAQRKVMESLGDAYSIKGEGTSAWLYYEQSLALLDERIAHYEEVVLRERHPGDA